ncbi:MAG: hypothetical protein A3A58_01505 [Candidatus Blackburnbacteria bacterium RIFCSPLOWO2_01_FULL_41_27]|uniref:SH3b domain-containing protein n=2 Tax=Candidatus Blackburniibacteriota TaxID=1817898 RepID=A0A1G1VBT8_9BACT|nr:MAG: hypothetical protein A3F61_04590 [Candidatus Blackburnbacteria bacterium RIFCSPHIGHO2_12_FULL_41_13b]OGY14324.1 MAG: hypothetical protein A3A58_01505 [Candidatus Blackburnbacteria bacterium RIFCSPLOWO2_01_FULL_41_27]
MKIVAHILFYYCALLSIALLASSFLANDSNRIYQLIFLPVTVYFVYKFITNFRNKNRDTENILRRRTILIGYAVLFVSLTGAALGTIYAKPDLLSPAVTSNSSQITTPSSDLEKNLSPSKVTETLITRQTENPEETGLKKKITIVKIKTNEPDGIVNVRQTPSADSVVVGTANNGQTFILVDADRKEGWYKIKLDEDKEGWVDYRYIEKVQGEKPEN